MERVQGRAIVNGSRLGSRARSCAAAVLAATLGLTVASIAGCALDSRKVGMGIGGGTGRDGGGPDVECGGGSHVCAAGLVCFGGESNGCCDGSCVACLPGSGRCGAANVVEACNEEGTAWERTALCSGDTPICDPEALTCVPSDCAPNDACCACTGPCQTCNDGVCAIVQNGEQGGCGAGSECQDGSCGTPCAAGREFHDGRCLIQDGQPCTNPDGSECVAGECNDWFIDLDRDGFGADLLGWNCGAAPPPTSAVTRFVVAPEGGDCCESDVVGSEAPFDGPEDVHPGQEYGPAFQIASLGCPGGEEVTTIGDWNCDGVDDPEGAGFFVGCDGAFSSPERCTERSGPLQVSNINVFTEVPPCGVSLIYSECEVVGDTCQAHDYGSPESPRSENFGQLRCR